MLSEINIVYLYLVVIFLQMTLEEAIGYVASDELIEVCSSLDTVFPFRINFVHLLVVFYVL